MKFLVMQYSPTFLYFLPYRSNYSLEYEGVGLEIIISLKAVRQQVGYL
jgi:hypothetical protein